MGDPKPKTVTAKRFNSAVAADAVLEGHAKAATESHSDQVVRRRVL